MTRAKGNPRRVIALGEPFDDGTILPAPKEETVEERLTRMERTLARIESTVQIIKEFRAERAGKVAGR